MLINNMRLQPMFNADGGGSGGGAGDEDKHYITFPDEASFMNRVKREAKKLVDGEIQTEFGMSKDELKKALTAPETIQKELDVLKQSFENLQVERDNLKVDKEKALQSVNDNLTQSELKAIAKELGIVDADVAYTLMKKDNVKIEDGKVLGIKESLEQLLTEKPYLKAQGTGKAGEDFSGGNGEKTPLTIEMIKGMSEKEIASRLDEVTKVLGSQGK